MSLLEVRDAAARFGDQELFTGLSLTLEAGEVLAVRGPSGSGKTTLLRGIAGLVPMDGTMRLDGEGPDDLGWPCWRSRVLLMAQRPAVHPETPAETWAALSGFASRRQEVGDPMAIAAQWTLPEGAWSKAWAKLSGGEQQRAALAMGLALKPRVLLLDEPTSALDPEAVEAVEDTLSGQTAIWVTHDDTQAQRVSTRVLDLGDR